MCNREHRRKTGKQGTYGSSRLIVLGNSRVGRPKPRRTKTTSQRSHEASLGHSQATIWPHGRQSPSSTPPTHGQIPCSRSQGLAGEGSIGGSSPSRGLPMAAGERAGTTQWMALRIFPGTTWRPSTTCCFCVFWLNASCVRRF